MPLKHNKVKRGDTIIEVMFAFAIFTMVALVSVVVINSGIAASERSLELVVARNELNAQVEALRFIHSSYIAERNLPRECTNETGKQCQQFAGLWEKIISDARVTASASESTPNRYTIPVDIDECKIIYEEDVSGNNLLTQNNAFVINTRLLQSNNMNNALIRATRGNDIFVEPLLGARLVFGLDSTYKEDDNSTTNLTDNGGILSQYRTLLKAEGIWVVAVAGPEKRYYDFHVGTCWYGAGASAPTTLDTVVRLYNPEGS